MKTVVVGSKNPVKIAGITKAFEQMFGAETFNVIGVSVDSGVPDQPWGDEQTIQGAKNRVEAAKKLHPDADFYVASEAGMMERTEGVFTCAWHYVQRADGKTSFAKGVEFLVPKKSVELVKAGMELGHANDEVFGMQNSKHSLGMSGILSNGVLPRERQYEVALVMALSVFVHDTLF